MQTRWLIAIAYAAASVSGLLKQLEVPGLVDLFDQSGVPPELLSLLGATEFALALTLLFQRTRRAGAVLLALLYLYKLAILWPLGSVGLLSFYGAMMLLVLAASFWRDSALRPTPRYLGAMPFAGKKPRR